MRPKIAVLAPMPRASETTAAAVKPGARRIVRRAYRISALRSSTICSPRASRPASHDVAKLISGAMLGLGTRDALRLEVGRARLHMEPHLVVHLPLHT
jgi:hypothetical protein